MIVFYRLLSESPNMRKISLMLEAVDLPYTIENIDPHSTKELDPAFSKISPTGTLPAIYDTETDVALFESGAILIYLAEKTHKLLPAKLENKAEVLKWLMFEVSNVCPTMIELHHYYLNDSGDIPDKIFTRYKQMIAEYCSILDNQLNEKKYLGGEFSIADLALYPWVVTLEDIAEIDVRHYPNLDQWATAIDNKF